MARKFHEAVRCDTKAGECDASAVAAMLADLPPWWATLLRRDNEDYMRLFMRSEHFQRLHAAYCSRDRQSAAMLLKDDAAAACLSDPH
jgi:hypothetical protein